MDHALRTISFIADIADVLVVMVRRFTTPAVTSESLQNATTDKICCHVLETDEVRQSRLKGIDKVGRFCLPIKCFIIQHRACYILDDKIGQLFGYQSADFV